MTKTERHEITIKMLAEQGKKNILKLVEYKDKTSPNSITDSAPRS